MGFEPLAPSWKNDYKARALTFTPSRRTTKVVKLMVYKARRVNTERKRSIQRKVEHFLFLENDVVHSRF